MKELNLIQFYNKNQRELSEDEIIDNHAEQCRHYLRNSFLPYENEWNCISCGYNVLKQKHELSKIQRKKINFINRLKYAERKLFCICIELYKTNECDDFDKIYQVLSTLKNQKIKNKQYLI